MTQPLQEQSDSHVNGNAEDSSPKEPDVDAQTMVIDSLRSQIQDLFSQVSQLNNKLVQSYDRVSDLEDQLHDASNNMRSTSIRISQLELERTQHLSALNSGLLVERTHVTAELTRLMEKATEEAARRGQAESARAEIEKDLDDLSAGLFGQANSMVAEARLGRAASERKVEETERALRGTEEAIGAMQVQMQALEAEKEEAQRQLEDIRITMGKGKWVQRVAHPDVESSKRLMSSHAQYRDFLFFVSHLREQRQKSPQVPAMSSLLSHSFLARLQTEDSDPTIRLDLAPSLNWLTRKSVLSAIHQGQLDIEPLPSETLMQELSSAQFMIPGLNNGSHISCALCGTFILSDPSSHSMAKPPPHPQSRQVNGISYSNWSSSLLKNPLVNSIAGSVLNTPSHSPTRSSPPPSHVFIFRLAADAARLMQTPSQNRSPPTIYPLCSSGWCLTRLRAACSLWAFVRTGVVEKIWEESLSIRRPSSPTKQLGPPVSAEPEKTEKDFAGPPLPPRRSRIGIFWERAASLGKGEEKALKEAEKTKKDDESRDPKQLPPPPPQHPAIEPSVTATVASPIVPQAAAPPAVAPPSVAAAAVAPPPLPSRHRPRASEPKQTATEEQTPAAAVDTPAPQPPRPVVEHASSEESFASAKEAPVAAPIPRAFSPSSPLRPKSPSAIALPDSQPGTPVFNAFPHHEQKPAVAGHPEVPSRTSSPAPPPLPRRAAARRPLSTVTHPPPSTANPELARATPAVEVVIEKPVEEPKRSETPAPITEDVSKPDESRTGVPESLDVVPVDPVSKLVEAVPEPEKPVNTEKSEQVEHPSQTEESVPPVDLDQATAEEESSEVITVNGIAISVVNDQDLVGDSSWEERTWKELVKLREDMFWARIGGLR